MISVETDFQVNIKNWVKQPQRVLDGGLIGAGEAWKAEARKYPPPPPNIGLQGTGTRTNNLAKKAEFRIINYGELMYLLGPKYYLYLIVGTGIYGPKGAPITPKSMPVKGPPMLVWPVTDGSHSLAGKMARAYSVRGTIWEGKKKAIALALREGFILGVKKAISKER
jgi:hypothetical protein